MHSKNVYIHIFFVLFVIFPLKVIFGQSQNYQPENLSIENGLHHNQINFIIQDSLGFIWCATPYGLERYDGYEFKLYQNDPDDSTSLPSNNILALYTDKQKHCGYPYRKD